LDQRRTGIIKKPDVHTDELVTKALNRRIKSQLVGV